MNNPNHFQFAEYTFQSFSNIEKDQNIDVVSDTWKLTSTVNSQETYKKKRNGARQKCMWASQDIQMFRSKSNLDKETRRDTFKHLPLITLPSVGKPQEK